MTEMLYGFYSVKCQCINCLLNLWFVIVENNTAYGLVKDGSDITG